MKIDYLLIGHITADLTPNGRILGGTAAYAARTAHAFGLRVGVLTSAREDDHLLDDLRQYADVVTMPSSQTTTYENIYTPQGRIQFLREIAAPITTDRLPDEWRHAPLVHIAPMADELQGTHVVADIDGAQSVLVTPQGWMRRRDAEQRVHFKPWFEQSVLARADFVVFSEEDVAEAPETGQQIIEASNCAIVTRSYHGGIYYQNGTQHPYAAVPADTVDPTGAGDIFAASFFAAYHRLGAVDLAVQVAAALAAYSVTRVGLASTPTSVEVQEALQNYDRQNHL